MDDAQHPGPGETFSVASSEEVYASGFTTIRLDRVRMPGGELATREIAEHASAVGAVVLDDDDEVLLLRHYRHAFGRRFLELPAGKLDVDGEDPAAAMQRELAEEVQLHAGTLAPLISFTNSAGWTTERTDVFLATDLTPAPRPGGFVVEHEEADIEILHIPLLEAIAMVHAGEIVDAKTVVGLLAMSSRRD